MNSASTGVYKDDDGIVMDIDLYNSTTGEKLEELFLCNTCAFTYIFDDGPYSDDVVAKEIYFRDADLSATVYF